ncbi:MAG: ECF transporter S component [Spirochaetia bacterium]|nr:ECF transporter S component [Spirochaetia bacterium]
MRTDPRLKFIFLILYSVLFFFFFSPLHYLLLFLPLLPAGISICGWKDFLKIFRAILPLVILTAVLTPLFFRSGTPVIQTGNFIWLTQTGLYETSRIIIRFFGITALFYLYFRTTSQDVFIQTLRFFGLPFKFALTISIASRYIPYLIRIYRNTENAHKMRKTEGCADPGRWNFIGRFRSTLPILASVLIQAIKNIPTLAMALETRGIRNQTGRKTGNAAMKTFSFRIAASAILTAIVVVMTILIRIPIGPTRGYLNFGDMAIFFSAITFGPAAGFIAGGLGTAIADILSGYSQWALFSLLIHGLQGFAIGFTFNIFNRNMNKISLFLSKFLVFFAGAVIMVAGYFFTGYFIVGPGAAISEIPMNILQNAVGAAGGFFLFLSVKKAYPPVMNFRW